MKCLRELIRNQASSKTIFITKKLVLLTHEKLLADFGQSTLDLATGFGVRIDRIEVTKTTLSQDQFTY